VRYWMHKPSCIMTWG